MGVFRKKAAFVPLAPELPVLGFVLLSEELTSITGLTAMLEGTLGVSVEVDAAEDGAVLLQIFGTDGATFISVVNRPVPDGEAEANAARNYFWADGIERVAGHRAHLMVTVLTKPDEPAGREQALASSLTFVNVLAALCGLDAAIGVYIGAHQLVHEAKPFRELALAAKKDDVLPAPLLVHLMAAPQPDGRSAGYTCGLRTFGHDELEIVDSQHAPDEVYALLANIVLFLITSDASFVPGETAGYTDEMRLPITLAEEASFVSGRALQIDF